MPSHASRPHRTPRLSALFAGASILLVSPASALEVKDCREAGLGIENLDVPVERAHLSLYDGKVQAYSVDTVEPVCCSSGIAVVLPAKDDPSGGNNCWAVIGLASVDIQAATRSYDKGKGLLLAVPVKRGNSHGDAVAGPPLKLRINFGAGTIALE